MHILKAKNPLNRIVKATLIVFFMENIFGTIKINWYVVTKLLKLA